VLDADSYMSAQAITGLVRRMEANPRSAFCKASWSGCRQRAPLPGLPVRHATRHALLHDRQCLVAGRLRALLGPQRHPAAETVHRALQAAEAARERPAEPVRILSHDQVEAVLMRRAGYEVRVLPLETGSYEVNPPHLLEFIRRDLRWCQGNLQYRRLLGMPGLKPVSRIQLVLAILMFLGSPAWIGFMVSAAIPLGW
jgi:membrane glycosyltransferase